MGIGKKVPDLHHIAFVFTYQIRHCEKVGDYMSFLFPVTDRFFFVKMKALQM